MSYTELTREILRTLNLPVSREGLRNAHKITRTPEAMKKRHKEGEWKGLVDSERVEREVLPKVLKETPQLLPVIRRLQEKDQGLWDICSTLDWFLEKTEELAGNRPLPSHIGVHVKNYEGEEPRFGFLFWYEGQCLVRIKEEGGLEDWPGRLGEERQTYPNSFAAAMDGWLVD